MTLEIKVPGHARGQQRVSQQLEAALHGAWPNGDCASSAKAKLDELFFEFLAQPATQAQVEKMLVDVRNGVDIQPSAPAASPVPTSPRYVGGSAGQVGSPPRSPRSGRLGSMSPRGGGSPRSPRSPSLANALSSVIALGSAAAPSSGKLELSPEDDPAHELEQDLQHHQWRRRRQPQQPQSPPQQQQQQHGLPHQEPHEEQDDETDEDNEQAVPELSGLSKRGESKKAPRELPRLELRRAKNAPEEDALFLEEVDAVFSTAAGPEGICMNDFVTVCKDLCNLPTFFNGPLCQRIRWTWQESGKGSGAAGAARPEKESKSGAAASDAGGEDEERKESKEEKVNSEALEDEFRVTKEEFLHFWERELAPFDEQDRFFRLLKQPQSEFVIASDFAPYLEELLAYHPGLEFLENTPEFQEKYARTVVARILYEVNTHRNGKISRRELRRSDLLAVCHQVDEEEDINMVLRYFSYEHFYTLYVKFWELDTDHDFLLSQSDLMRHGGHALTPAIVERIFEQPVYNFFSGLPDRMGYEDFVFFFLAEEDKANPVSLRYWFSCVDLDGDGVLRPWELRHFYDQQLSRLQSYGHEIIPFADILCQAHDFVHPREEGAFVLADFCRPEYVNISGMLFNILFNLNKFIAFEQRDPNWIRQQHESPGLTDWDRYAAAEYARLASAEEEREMEEESFGHWDGADVTPEGGGSSWLQYNESPF